MNRFISLAHAALVATTLIGATAAIADPMPLTSNLVTTDPYQNGRLSRNGIPQTVAMDEPYPGTNPSTVGSPYHYHVYTIDVGAANYVNITFDVTNAASYLNAFIAAYQSAYYVTSFQKSWLGDVGSSEFFGQDVGSFAFTATPFSQVLLVVNAGSASNAGIGAANPYTIYAQEAMTNDFSDAFDVPIVSGGRVIPEPSTLLLLAPLALVVAAKRRRRSPVATAG